MVVDREHEVVSKRKLRQCGFLTRGEIDAIQKGKLK
jgi:hypothetical protein